MKAHFLFFFGFIGIFFFLIALIPIDFGIDSSVLLGSFFGDKIWQFIIIGVCIFLFGKQLADHLANLENKQ